MHVISWRRLSPHAASLLAATLLGAALLALPVHADQDDAAERVPSSAGDVYSPIERTFERQQRTRALATATELTSAC